MKKMLKSLSGAICITVLISLAAFTANANPLQDAWNAGITNGAIGGGYWRSTTGNYNIASYDLVYNIAPANGSLGAGLIAGGDYMWSKGNGIQNDVKGGFSLNYELHPLQSFGITNSLDTLTVFGGDAVATPHGNAVGVGNIAFAGADWKYNIWKRLDVHLEGATQTRTGQGEFDRTYIGVMAYISYGGGTASLLAANDRYLEYAYANLQPNFDQ